ncbi:hypothetical protein ACWN8V_01050 [Vagococcus elongatus]|uniref:Uncharacterized protein n=1 Tax=Vagococcus elongatus TaxID=180344 RepID=A0A430B5V9_9ENTE|nr:hypothetical protein [Vagococcus elongatus]RSU15688.1 hypothetical protein CBF29_01030 [Vagococcus elongatus]
MKKVITIPRVLLVVSILLAIPYFYFLYTDLLYLRYLYLPLSRGIFYIGNLLVFTFSIINYRKTKIGSYKLPLYFSLVIMLFLPVRVLLFFLAILFYRP